jgi:hypothetical protein
MRLAISVVVASVGTVVSVGTAMAQPVPCAVNIARAPDDVREVVEGWLRNENHCRGDLEVRIVPTDGGLYLFARDGAGRVRERVVPDAQSAGVLVASWAADDEIVTPISAAPAVRAPANQPNGPAMAPIEAQASPVATHGHVMLGVGALFGSVYGIRADLDTTRYGRFVFGLSVGASAAQLDGGDAPLTMRDLDALVYAGVVLQSDRFWLRGQVGVGGITSEFNTLMTFGSEQVTGGDSAPLVEASVRLGVDLGAWTLSAGPIARYYRERWTVDNGSMLLQRDGDISFFVGVGRRL